MNYIKIAVGILLMLSASRFIPHPPNFTSLIALSFYIPAVLGSIYIFPVVLCYFFTDLFLGIHQVVFFTWGSIIFIGLISKYFVQNLKNRIFGCLIGVFIFFILTNFGVWSMGSYGYSLNGLITCYTLALPFLGNTLVSTLLFASIIEILLGSKKYLKRKIFN